MAACLIESLRNLAASAERTNSQLEGIISSAKGNIVQASKPRSSPTDQGQWPRQDRFPSNSKHELGPASSLNISFPKHVKGAIRLMKPTPPKCNSAYNLARHMSPGPLTYDPNWKATARFPKTVLFPRSARVTTCNVADEREPLDLSLAQKTQKKKQACTKYAKGAGPTRSPVCVR